MFGDDRGGSFDDVPPLTHEHMPYDDDYEGDAGPVGPPIASGGWLMPAPEPASIEEDRGRWVGLSPERGPKAPPF